MPAAASSRPAPVAAPDVEFQLLCACSRVRMSAEDASHLASLLDQPWESDLLLALADQHGLGPLLFQHLGAHNAVPVSVREKLRSTQAQGARQTLVLTNELLRLHGQLQQGGVTTLAFKGPALAQALYGGLGLRPFGDLDLVVRPSDVPAAREVLRSNGYEPTIQFSPALEPDYIRTQYEYGMVHPDSGIYVELQWAIAPRFYCVDFDMEQLWSGAGPVQLGEALLPAPAPSDLVLLLSVHAAKHAWSRLIWLVDLRELILRYPGLDWSQLLQRARRAGVLRVVLVTLLLAQQLVGARLPSAVTSQVEQDSRIPVLAGRLRQAVTTGSTEFLSPAPGHFTMILSLRERWFDRARFVTRLALTPTNQDWNAMRLPRWLFPFYRVIRLARALRHLPEFCAMAGRRT